jgi:hypothetical protein
MNRIRKFTQALADGDWYGHAKATNYWGDVAIGVGLAISAVASGYNTASQAGIANRQLSIADDQRWKEDQSYQQLQQLMTDPSSFFASPVYQAAAKQGTQAVARSNAAAFGPNSGNEAGALQLYGQSFGQQQLLGQEQLLAGMSGAGYNPSGALSGASGAASSAAGSMASLGGLMAFFGSSGSGAGGTGAAQAGWTDTAFAPG